MNPQCVYCEDNISDHAVAKLPFCEHHAHPACVWVAHEFSFKNKTLECLTCHAKQTDEIRILKNDRGVEYTTETEVDLLGGGSIVRLRANGQPARRVVTAPPPEVQVVQVPVVGDLRAQRRAEFNAHRQAGRIPATARFGGIHERNCGHRGCNRRGGAMGVRFFDGLYRCEVHR
jgi:hypothetical protein